MKKTLVLSILSAMFGMISAQSPRLVLVEEFTQASCPPCASQNPAFNTLLQANTAKAVSVKYQVSWPGVDPMNQQNPSQVANRVSYYGVTGVPDAVIDGTAYQGSPSGVSQAMIDNQQAVASPFTITVNHWLNAATDSIFINCVVTATMANSMGMPKLHVALIEKLITDPNAQGTNGETQFEGVMRKMYPHAGGTELEENWILGQSKTVSFKVPVPSYIYDKDEMAIVAWVQDDADKNVKQAGFSETAGAALNVAPIADFGADVISSCNGIVNFQDLSAQFPTAWAWDFGDGGSSNLQHPTHTFASSGSYNVTLMATNSNGQSQLVKNAYVNISLAGQAPTALNANICGPGVANLSATAVNGGIINWFDVAGNFLATGASYSPTVTGGTSFRASESIPNAPFSIGALDTTIAAGVFFTANNVHGLYFDVNAPCELQSVKVYSDAYGDRTIDVIDAYGNTAFSAVRNIPAGESVVNLNFDFPVGQKYLIKISSTTVNLYRNAGGASFPYVNNAITITGNTAGGNPTYYYFFYDWKVKEKDCVSPFTVVEVVDTCLVGAPEPGSLSASMQVSPNPSNGRFELSFDAVRKADYRIQVTNALGQTVFAREIPGYQGRYVEQIDLSAFAQGMFVLTVSDGRSKAIRKLVKN